MTGITNINNLEGILERSVGINNSGQAERDRDLAKTGALLSIARSLESTRVPDHWEALESPSGAILGWFDPQVARTIAQALAASQGRQQDEDDEPLPIEVGSVVVLTDALELAGDNPEDIEALTMGQVLELGVTEDEHYALVAWLEDGVVEGEPVKVWVKHLTALEQREAEPVGVPDGHNPDKVNHYYADALGDPTTCTDEGHNHPEPEPVEVAVLDGGGGASSGLEVEGDDDIDADFDTVVEPEPTPTVDPLTALKGKSAKGKGK